MLAWVKGQYSDVELTHCTTPLKKRANRGDRKKGEEIGKGERGVDKLYRIKQTKKGERNEALTFLNYFKLLMNLLRVMLSAFDTELKPSQKCLSRVVNFNLQRDEQLQRMYNFQLNLIAICPVIIR